MDQIPLEVQKPQDMPTHSSSPSSNSSDVRLTKAGLEPEPAKQAAVRLLDDGGGSVEFSRPSETKLNGSWFRQFNR